LPTDPDAVVSKLFVKIDDKLVESKIMEKEKAKEEYDDAIASGHSAALMQESEEDKDLLKLFVGNILPNQIATIKIVMIKKLDIEGGAYALRIPTSYFPKYDNS
jgi:hypothetical protein